MYCVCEEHLSRAIDMFVEEYEEAPDVYELDQLSFTDWQTPQCCHCCETLPKFLVI